MIVTTYFSKEAIKRIAEKPNAPLGALTIRSAVKTKLTLEMLQDLVKRGIYGA